MDRDGTAISIARQPVKRATLRLRLADPPVDDSVFLVLAFIAGAICGSLLALV